LLIQAHSATSNIKGVLGAAEEELAFTEKTGDKRAELALLRTISDALIADRQWFQAIPRAKRALDLTRKLQAVDEEVAQLLIVSNLQDIIERPYLAMEAAEKALKLSQKLGNKDLIAQAKRQVSHLMVTQGKVEQAPNRPQALEALSSLSRAALYFDGEAYQEATQRLEEVSGYTEADVARALEPAVAKDRQATINFIKKQGQDVESGTQTVLKAYTKKVLYLEFRMGGGLGYGPRFRTCTPLKVSKSSELHSSTATVLKMYSAQEEWGKNLLFHPGLMDGGQHQLNAQGL